MAVRWSEKLFNYPLAYRAKFLATGAVVSVLKPLIFKQHFTIEEVLAEDIDKNASVLEIGCGDGHNYRLLTAQGWSGQFTGIDSNPAMVAHCQATYPEASWLKASVPPYDVGTHDVVLIVNVLHHLDNMEHIESIMREALRLGRKVVMFEPMQSEGSLLHSVKRLYWTITDGGNLYFRHNEFISLYGRIGGKVVKERLTSPLRQFYSAVLEKA